MFHRTHKMKVSVKSRPTVQFQVLSLNIAVTSLLLCSASGTTSTVISITVGKRVRWRRKSPAVALRSDRGHSQGRHGYVTFSSGDYSPEVSACGPVDIIFASYS